MCRRFLPIVLLCLALTVSAAAGNGLDAIQLPAPAKSGGVTLTEALAKRQSSRDFADVELSPQQLADLLWCTAGVNRPDGKKVYPVARNRHDMTVYVVMRRGVYRYDPTGNRLEPVAEGDHRAKTGTQPFVGRAAVNLAYVHDMNMWTDTDHGAEFGFTHTGEMAQNAYLYAAGQNWAAVIRGMFDRDAMRDLLKLPENLHVRLVQSIGPKG